MICLCASNHRIKELLGLSALFILNVNKRQFQYLSSHILKLRWKAKVEGDQYSLNTSPSAPPNFPLSTPPPRRRGVHWSAAQRSDASCEAPGHTRILIPWLSYFYIFLFNLYTLPANTEISSRSYSTLNTIAENWARSWRFIFTAKLSIRLRMWEISKDADHAVAVVHGQWVVRPHPTTAATSKLSK